MSSIKVLDVTLRDGGCVNNFNFGLTYMTKILAALEKSGVDYIELGYIDEQKGSTSGRTQFCNERVIIENFLTYKMPGVKYVAMIDYGKFDPDKLEVRTEQSIDGIRCAFHKKDWKEIIKVGRTVIEKGYEFFIQPMLTMRYRDDELIALIQAVNEEIPDASGFYIVDSFGEMRGNDVVRLMHLVDHNLIPEMPMGFHSHNNLQLSYANAMSLLTFPTGRSLMIDASVMGMGKGAGNLNTELLMEHLNLYYGKNYKIGPLLELADQVINVIHKEIYWGYSAEYYLSSVNSCTPSYASHFYNKHTLPIDQVAELLRMIDESKKQSFDKDYAESLYLQYNANKKYDDSKVFEELKSKLTHKKVLLIAPGKSIAEKRELITRLLSDESVVSISLNNYEFKTDYSLVSRSEMLDPVLEQGAQVIATSNIARDRSECAYVIDYAKWIIVKERVYDSSSVIALQLLQGIGVSEILLAGFDGFSMSINENYYDMAMRRPASEEQIKRRNAFYSEYIHAMVADGVKIAFVTPSLYE